MPLINVPTGSTLTPVFIPDVRTRSRRPASPDQPRPERQPMSPEQQARQKEWAIRKRVVEIIPMPIDDTTHEEGGFPLILAFLLLLLGIVLIVLPFIAFS